MPLVIGQIQAPLPAGTNNIGDVDVVSTVLPSNAATETTLAAIKDTAGIKKITDALPAGTNNIGDVDVLTLPAGTVAGGSSLPAGTNNIGDVDVLTLPAGTVAGGSSLPAGTNNIGDVDVLTLPAGTVAGGSSLPAGTNNIGDVDVLTLPAGTVAGGASLPAGANNIGDVDILSIIPGTASANLGKLANDPFIASGTGVQMLGVRNDSTAQTTYPGLDANTAPIATDLKGNQLVVGNLPNDAVDVGNPVKIGGQARTTNPTAVADADRVNAMFDKQGKQIVRTVAPRELVTDTTTTITASTSETTILAAGAGGVFHDITMLTVANTSATDVRIDFRSATAGAVRFSWLVPAGSTIGGVMQTPINQTTAANNWTAQSSASVTDLRIFAQAAKNL